MSETLRSILLGTCGLSTAAIVSLALTLMRRPRTDAVGRDRAVQLLLIGIAIQCGHFSEEFITGFHVRFPRLLGLAPWPAEFFVVFNVIWMAVWVLSALGVRAGSRIAFFPVWFFAIGMALNGVAHPLLAVASGGYFPGLITSPAAGVVGVLLWQRLCGLTRKAGA